MTSPRRAPQQQPGAGSYLAVPCGAEYNAAQEGTGNAERAENAEDAERERLFTAEHAETAERNERER